MRTIVMLMLAATLLAASGCWRSSERVVVHPVKGKVEYGGEPAEGVQVFFYPLSAPAMPDIPSNPRGVTGPDGCFTLSTFGDADGAAEGEYLVILLWPKKTAEDNESAPDQLLGWYTAAHSKLNVRVVAGENDVPCFKLERVSAPPPVSQGIPGRN